MKSLIQASACLHHLHHGRQQQAHRLGVNALRHIDAEIINQPLEIHELVEWLGDFCKTSLSATSSSKLRVVPTLRIRKKTTHP